MLLVLVEESGQSRLARQDLLHVRLETLLFLQQTLLDVHEPLALLHHPYHTLDLQNLSLKHFMDITEPRVDLQLTNLFGIVISEYALGVFLRDLALVLVHHLEVSLQVLEIDLLAGHLVVRDTLQVLESLRDLQDVLLEPGDLERDVRRDLFPLQFLVEILLEPGNDLAVLHRHRGLTPLRTQETLGLRFVEQVRLGA